MTTIYLVRHGEAEGNAFRRIHGQYDSLLTPTGFRQVEALARRFREIPVDACFSSDLTRTSLTARAVYVPQKLPLYRDPAFREICLGSWEDLTFGYLERFEPEAIACFRKDPVSWHIQDGEDFETYTSRFIRGMKAAASRFPGKRIAIFCHSAVLRGVLMELFFQRDVNRVPYCDNTAVSKLFWDGKTFTYGIPERQQSPAGGLEAHPSGSRREPKPVVSAAGGAVNPGPAPAARGSVSYLAVLEDAPVGLVSLDRAQGQVTRLFLQEACRGSGMEEQTSGPGGQLPAQMGASHPVHPADRTRNRAVSWTGMGSRQRESA
ncbi:MAG: histidine phosphatase family protein [Oscillospiraceae bacterium]